MHVKTVKITNPKNVLVQLPGFIVNNWSLGKGDGIEVHESEDEQTIIIRPRKGLVHVRPGSNTNRESKGLVE
jgi:hypothetical protein